MNGYQEIKDLISDIDEFHNEAELREILQQILFICEDKLKNESIYCNEDVDTYSSMVTLSTCDLDYGLNSNRRLLLSGFLEEYDETIIVH